MKKKILSLVLAACMLCGFSTTAFAETTVDGDGEASIPVTYHQESHYMVTIPESIDLNGDTLTMECYRNISDNEVIDVKVADSTIHVQNANGETEYGYFAESNGVSVSTDTPIIQFTSSNSYEQTFNYSFFLQDPDAKAGDYTGSMTFYFSLRTIE